MNFISDFMRHPLPQECVWMTHYFSDEIGFDFIKYFHIFRNSVHFSEHMGHACSERWVKKMKSRFLRLEKAREEARKNFDFELLSDIEIGDYKLK